MCPFVMEEVDEKNRGRIRDRGIKPREKESKRGRCGRESRDGERDGNVREMTGRNEW